MSAIAFLIEQTAVALYIFIGVGVVWHFRRWVQAGYALRSSYYELERDFARQRRSSALFVVILLFEAGLFVVGVQNFVAPVLREDQEVQRAMAAVDPDQQILVGGDGIFATSTPPAIIQRPDIDDSDIELGVDTGGVIFITPTPTFTPVGTIEPNAPAPVGCSSPNAMLQIPANGMRVFQVTPIRGTAFVDNFSELKLEISGPSTLGQFATLATDPMQARELTTLYQFDPNPYEPGTYQFRLVVFDTSNTVMASCQITIYISDPIPTATPLAP
ncbi:MAG: hypothetical protein EA396_13225 [Anaerolineaceae bacterium]|nr:MAG: hypothetical protein EA396_13225 [Anaerolineaceae bacterium]